jgi:hypothetical protein
MQSNIYCEPAQRPANQEKGVIDKRLRDVLYIDLQHLCPHSLFHGSHPRFSISFRSLALPLVCLVRLVCLVALVVFVLSCLVLSCLVLSVLSLPLRLCIKLPHVLT